MQIDSIELFHLRLPTGDTVLVRLASGGIIGWGEACADRMPTNSAEWAGGVFASLRDVFAVSVLGKKFSDGESLQKELEAFQGNALAKSAIDAAWWSLHAQSKGVTLAAAIGVKGEPPESSVTLGPMESETDFLAAVGAIDAAKQVALLKFLPTWGEPVLRAVRQAYPGVALAIEFDGHLHLGQRDMFYRLEDFMPRWFEQPLAADDLVAHAMLQEAIRTPICLHQSITSVARLEQALDLGAARVVKIDPAMVGGITPALAVHAAAAQSDVKITVGGDCRTAVGADVIAALAKLNSVNLPVESFPHAVGLDGILGSDGLPKPDLIVAQV